MKIDRETAQIWAKEAVFQNARTADFIQMCTEMDGFSPIEAIMRHQTKVKSLLVKDRNESMEERYSKETLFHT